MILFVNLIKRGKGLGRDSAATHSVGFRRGADVRHSLFGIHFSVKNIFIMHRQHVQLAAVIQESEANTLTCDRSKGESSELYSGANYRGLGTYAK